jgi:endonuclease/exonuclease/phosphatase family metal-dependent hydrolase
MGLHNDGGRNDVVARCREIDADLLVLQEAWWWGATESDLAESVAETVGGELFVYTSPTPVRKYPVKWSIAIISRYPAERLLDHPLPSIYGSDRAMIRIRLRDSGIVVAGGHLDGIHAARRNPLSWMRQRAALRALAPSHDVVAADFNMWGPIVAHDLRPLRRAVRGRTWPAWRPHSQIDHLMVGDRLDVVAGEVLPDMGSDHLPVVAALRLR